MKKFTFILFAMVMMALTMNSLYAATPKVTSTPNAGQIIAATMDTIHGDLKGTVTTVYNDGKELLTNLYPDVKNAIIAIGKAIGVAAEHVYEVLVKKYVVEGIKYLFIFVIGLILLIIGSVAINKHIKAGKPITYALVLPTISLVASICIFFNIDYNAMLMGLINPEWGAINYILEYSKEIIK